MDKIRYNRKVLVVDDDPANIKLIREVLLHEKCEVQAASSGREALQLLKTFDPALVVLDQDMPGMTGLETLREIKALKKDCDVMFVSAHTSPQMVSTALEQGADDYIRKPFSIVELISRVHVRFRIRDLREELKTANAKLAELSVTDDLTGLYNMRSMYERIDYEIKRANRSGKSIACVMIDMDHFKSVNDDHDHLFGSFVIKEMGQILQKNLREVDFAARYGGDEFLVVLTETDLNGAQIFCERIREKIKNHVFKEGNDQIRLTLSVGYSIGASGFIYNSKDLVRVADHGLYLSKEKGRDQVNGFGPNETFIEIQNFNKKAA